MAQPPLSRAIGELERQPGVRLLQRTTREVRLTPAAQALLRDARTALDAIAAAAGRARTAAGAQGRYRHGPLPSNLATCAREPGVLPVEVLMGGRDEQVPALRDGRADVALLPAPFDRRGVESDVWLTEPRLAAVAVSDPLAACPCLRLADFAGRVLLDGAAAESGGAVRGTRRPGLDPAQLFNLVELGQAVWFLPLSVARRHGRPGITYRTVEDLDPFTLALAWPHDARSPAVAAFVRTAVALAQSLASEAVSSLTC